MNIEEMYRKMKLDEAAGSRSADSDVGDAKSPGKLKDQFTSQPGAAKLGAKVAGGETSPEKLSADGKQASEPGSADAGRASVKGRTMPSHDGNQIHEPNAENAGVSVSDVHGDQGEFDGKPKTVVSDMTKKDLGEASLNEKGVTGSNGMHTSAAVGTVHKPTTPPGKKPEVGVPHKDHGGGTVTHYPKLPQKAKKDVPQSHKPSGMLGKIKSGIKSALRIDKASVEEFYSNFIAEYEAVLEENGINEYDEEEAINFFVEQFGDLFVEAKDEDKDEDEEDEKDESEEKDEDEKDDLKEARKEDKVGLTAGMTPDEKKYHRAHLNIDPLRAGRKITGRAGKVAKPNLPKDILPTTESFQFQLSDQLGGLLESEGLTDEFKTQATTIFEAAVNAAAKGHIESIQEQLQEQYETEVASYKEKLDEQVEKYLDYVVEEWVKQNKLAVESAARNNVAESFMARLKDLLEEHYVQLPEEKADLYESEVQRAESLEAELNESIEAQRQLAEQVKQLNKKLQVESFVRDLSEVEAEKIRELSEGVEFQPEGFAAKLKTLKENFFPTRKAASSMIVEDTPIVESAPVQKVAPVMDKYLSVLGKMESFSKK
jgi:hypothetical protein